jgi:hypothetical protein
MKALVGYKIIFFWMSELGQGMNTVPSMIPLTFLIPESYGKN